MLPILVILLDTALFFYSKDLTSQHIIVTDPNVNNELSGLYNTDKCFYLFIFPLPEFSIRKTITASTLSKPK
ncbi:hypothetical protein MANES_12G142950v8 [Manihot esculenta]|uniref:Uncharacterized protein n=1 Tax=Manihot esculenta TaxID=3983 RepID=A0ACB7GRY8_MANES|nr:hypothetical protein MANES_12G142950v8 [Manihot esculenta]